MKNKLFILILMTSACSNKTQEPVNSPLCENLEYENSDLLFRYDALQREKDDLALEMLTASGSRFEELQLSKLMITTERIGLVERIIEHQDLMQQEGCQL